MSWWGSDSRNAAIQQALKLYEGKNAGITVNPEFGGYTGYQEKMTTQLAGGTAADVIRLDSMWVNQYKGQLVDLNQYKDEIGLSNFDPSVLAPLTVNGKLMGLPLSTNYRGFYFNKTVLDQYGIDAPKSWNDIINMKSKLPDDTYPIMNFVGNKTGTPVDFLTLMAQQTGKCVSDDKGNLNYTEADFENLLNFYSMLVDKKIMPSKKDVDNAGIVSGAPPPPQMAGKWIGFFEFTANTSTITNQLKGQGYDLAFGGFPKVEGNKSSGVWTKPSMVYSIPDSSKNKNDAAKLINFIMNDPDAITAQKLENGVPDSKAGKATIDTQNLITPLVSDTIKLGLQEKDPNLAVTYRWDTAAIDDFILDVITKLDYKQYTVQQAAKQLYDTFKSEGPNIFK